MLCTVISIQCAVVYGVQCIVMYVVTVRESITIKHDENLGRFS